MGRLEREPWLATWEKDDPPETEQTTLGEAPDDG